MCCCHVETTAAYCVEVTRTLLRCDSLYSMILCVDCPTGQHDSHRETFEGKNIMNTESLKPVPQPVSEYRDPSAMTLIVGR